MVPSFFLVDGRVIREFLALDFDDHERFVGVTVGIDGDFARAPLKILRLCNRIADRLGRSFWRVRWRRQEGVLHHDPELRAPMVLA